MGRKPSVPGNREPAERLESDRSRIARPGSELHDWQIRQIMAGLTEADNDQFVPDREMRQLWRRFGA